METIELLEILNRGEDSRHQFKENFTNVNSLAAEMVALANTQGGKIIVGVNDNGEITGLHHEDIGRLNQLVSNAASQSVKPPINPNVINLSLTVFFDTASGTRVLGLFSCLSGTCVLDARPLPHRPYAAITARKAPVAKFPGKA